MGWAEKKHIEYVLFRKLIEGSSWKIFRYFYFFLNVNNERQPVFFFYSEEKKIYNVISNYENNKKP